MEIKVINISGFLCNFKKYLEVIILTNFLINSSLNGISAKEKKSI